MKKLLFGLVLIAWLIGSCASASPAQPSDTAHPTPTIDSVIEDSSALPSLLSMTSSPLPSSTPRESRNEPTSTPVPPTSLPTIPTFTPTFDAQTIVTVTPASPAECPKENSRLIADFSIPDPDICHAGGFCFVNDTAEEIQLFLNQGGTISSVIARLNKATSVKEVTGGDFFLDDLTHDSIPEFVFRDFSTITGVFIFTCKSGKYDLFQFLNDSPTHISSVEDLNKNGIPDLILSSGFCSGSGCLQINVLEWDGQTYKDLSNNEIWISGPSEPTGLIDINNDGIKEIRLTGDRPGSCCMDLTTPWRYKTVIYSWNGSTYSESYVSFDKPQYRFQAVQDADREISYSRLTQALELYQDAIFNDQLSWWSKDRKNYEVELFYNSHKPVTPTPLPYPSEDTTEYPKLAAYSYYRIMLLHTVRGYESDAGTVYNTLQQKFGADPNGRPYVEMATTFWDAYQSTHKMYDGCAAAIQYAAEHPEILIPLGSDYHGWQSHTYVPADVCPFR